MMIRGLGPAHDSTRCHVCRDNLAGAGLERARAAGITGLRDLWTSGA